MVAIVTRAGKGSPLTNAEVDSNFTNLNDGKVENTQAGILAALGYTPYKANDNVTFGTLIATGQTSLGGTTGNESLRVLAPAATGAFLQVQTASGSGVVVRGTSDTNANVSISFISRGTAGHSFATGGAAANQQFAISNTSSAVNYIQVTGSTTTNRPTLSVQGTDTDAGLNITSKGQAGIFFYTGNLGNRGFTISSVASAVNYLQANPSAASANPSLQATGTDANIDLLLTAKGTGVIRANGNEVLTTASTYAGTLTSGQVTTALGYTPLNPTTSQTANTVYAAPNGSAGAPTFRALVSADLPTYTGTLTSSQITTGLGFTPYNSTNPAGYITNTGNARVGVENNGTLVGTRRNINFIPGTGISYTIADDSANEEVDITITNSGVTSFNTRTGAVTLSSSDVTTALGFTPYNSTNPAGYVTSSGSVNYATTAGSSNLANAKWQSAAIAGSQGTNVSAVEVRNNSGTGDSNLANITFHCQGSYGTSLHLRPDGYFGVGGWSASTWRWYVNLGNGDMVAAGNVTAYSDERLKKDWGTLPDDFVEQLAAVRHGTYTRIDSGARQVGVSAQSLQRVLPDAVGVGEDGDTLQVSYGNAALASAVKLAQRVVELTARLRALEQKMGA